MKVRMLFARSTAVVMAAGASMQTNAVPPPPAVAHAPPHVKPKPEVGTFGFNVNGMDRSVAPGDDFVRDAARRAESNHRHADFPPAAIPMRPSHP